MSQPEYLLTSQADELSSDGCCSLWDGMFERYRKLGKYGKCGDNLEEYEEFEKHANFHIKPHNCEVNCQACDLILRVFRERLFLGKDGPDTKFYVSLVSRAEVLSIFLKVLGQELRLHGIEGTSNPWNLTGTSRLAKSTGFPFSMTLAQLWLDECLTQHTEDIVTSNLPTRVLDLSLSDSSTIALIETNGSRGRYVCLSYCWGGSEFVMTTTETFESHRRGIAIQSLPRTFQDAIQVCRALGVQYLWVDALCIIQKQKGNADWNKESVCMADVYRNSYFTIAAVSSDSVRGGCFKKTRKNEVSFGPITVQQMWHFPDDPADAMEFPLLRRGWAYQERMLAPRILYFGRYELLWDCKHRRTCECGGASYQAKEVEKDYYAKMVSEGRCENPVALQQVWRNVVVQYSRLWLTFRTDKLPALSGLADELQRCTRQRYLAGLWKDSLLVDMCWYRDQVPLYDYNREENRSCMAPTWSWASIDVPVTYCNPLFTREGHTFKFYKHAKVLDARCILGGPSLTGPVTGGFVTLSCALIPASVCGDMVLARHVQLQWQSDRRSKIKTVEGYYVIPLITVERHLFGLVVTRNNKKSKEVVRVGLAMTHGVHPREMGANNLRRIRIV